MADFEIDISEVLRDMNLLEKVMQNPRPFLEMIASRMELIGKRSFEQQRSPVGVPWTPLSPKYAVRKAKKGKGAQGILRFSGRLIRSLYSGVEGRKAFVSTGPLVNANVHQYGFSGPQSVAAHIRKQKSRNVYGRLEGKRGRRLLAVGIAHVTPFTRYMRMPPRPYLGVSDRDLKEIIQDVEDMANKMFGGEGTQK